MLACQHAHKTHMPIHREQINKIISCVINTLLNSYRANELVEGHITITITHEQSINLAELNIFNNNLEMWDELI
jgi:hypothetical protein